MRTGRRVVGRGRTLRGRRHARRRLTSRAIAAELGIAERTVKDHLAVIYARLDASTRAEAVARAAELGVLPRALTRAAGSPVAAPSAAPSTTAALG
jgi:hypothetical protein